MVLVSAYKVVLLGASSVGKTSISNRIVKNKFIMNEQSTIGAAFMISRPKNNIRLEIWDTAGQERYASLAPLYYRGADAAILVYDITCRQSYTDAQRWYNELSVHSPNTKIFLVGNKLDLVQNMQHPRKVTYKEADDYAYSINVPFYETSAKLPINIKELLDDIVIKMEEIKKEDNNNIELKYEYSTNCCYYSN